MVMKAMTSKYGENALLCMNFMSFFPIINVPSLDV